MDPQTILTMNKRGKFLKKLWCCASVGVIQDNLLLSTEGPFIFYEVGGAGGIF